MAYLTASSRLDNTFLVGSFTPPTEPKPNPDPPGPTPAPGPSGPGSDPVNPPQPTEAEKGRPKGYIFEPYWTANGTTTYSVADKHRLLAGSTTVKDPYIGIGRDSEPGYVLACIVNPMKENVYFTLCDGWAPVDGCVTEVTISAANGSKPAVTDGSPRFYSEGLFKWVGSGNSSGSPLVTITPTDSNGDGKGDADAWTGHPVFTYVYTAKNGLSGSAGSNGVLALTEENRKMTVWAYIAQSSGTQDGSSAPVTAAYVETQAKAWATNRADPNRYPGYTAPTP